MRVAMGVWICEIALAGWLLQAKGQTPTRTVPVNTPVEIELQEGLSSETLHPGQEIAFKVIRPVIVDGETVISAGTPLAGEVRGAQKAGAFRKAGMLQLALKAIRLENGSLIQLEFPSPRVRSATREKTATGIAAGPVMLYYFPLIPFALAENVKKGAPFTIRAGERYRVYVVRSDSEAEGREPATTAAEAPKQ